jgi:hypothetical protein
VVFEVNPTIMEPFVLAGVATQCSSGSDGSDSDTLHQIEILKGTLYDIACKLLMKQF